MDYSYVISDFITRKTGTLFFFKKKGLTTRLYYTLENGSKEMLMGLQNAVVKGLLSTSMISVLADLK